MGIDDLRKKATGYLNSDKGEQATDAALDRAASLVDAGTGRKHTDKITRGRDTLDEKIGTDAARKVESSGSTRADTEGTTGTDTHPPVP